VGRGPTQLVKGFPFYPSQSVQSILPKLDELGCDLLNVGAKRRVASLHLTGARVVDPLA